MILEGPLWEQIFKAACGVLVILIFLSLIYKQKNKGWPWKKKER